MTLFMMTSAIKDPIGEPIVSFLTLTMAPDVSRNVRPSIFSCILAVLFIIK